MSKFRRAIFLFLAILLNGCSRTPTNPPADHPRLAPGVVLHDIVFHSISLGRNMPYRAVVPAGIKPGRLLPVVYVLHGGGGDFREWTNNSDIARFAADGLILIMPEGASSYYTNSAKHPQDRYEDYMVKDLIKDVESRFPVEPERPGRAIIGNSMGGFGAVKLALKYPQLFSFAAGLSSALDVPSRPFSIKRISQWRDIERYSAIGRATRSMRMIRSCSRDQRTLTRCPIFT